MKNDMTQGNPIKLILLFSIPLLIGNIFQQFYSIVDTVIVGRTIGANALAAVGSTGALMFLVLGFVQGMTGGFSVVAAQRYGAGDMAGVRSSVATSIILSVIVSSFITFISTLGARWLLEAMRTPPDIIEDAYAYLIIIFAGILATTFYNLIANMIRAIGDSRTPLVFLIVSCVINVVLDYLFIVSFHMGIAGAAYATVIAQLCAGVMCLIYTVKRHPFLILKKEDWRSVSWSLSATHLKIGLPMAFQFSITAIGVVVVQSALNRLGTATVAAYTAASRLGDIMAQPLGSLGLTMATFTAQNYGAKKMDRIREGVRKCTMISLIFSIAGGLTVVFFGGTFVKFFIKDVGPEIIEQAQIYLNIIAGFLFVLGVLFIYRNTLQGLGSTLVPMIAGVSELVMRVVVVMSVLGTAGYVGVCFAEPIAWIGGALPLAIKYFIEIKKLAGKSKQVV
ncbi:MAG: MATE family efflux transporter [Oscillospiraceae bacterium]